MVSLSLSISLSFFLSLSYCLLLYLLLSFLLLLSPFELVKWVRLLFFFADSSRSDMPIWNSKCKSPFSGLHCWFCRCHSDMVRPFGKLKDDTGIINADKLSFCPFRCSKIEWGANLERWTTPMTTKSMLYTRIYRISNTPLADPSGSEHYRGVSWNRKSLHKCIEWRHVNDKCHRLLIWNWKIVADHNIHLFIAWGRFIVPHFAKMKKNKSSWDYVRVYIHRVSQQYAEYAASSLIFLCYWLTEGCKIGWFSVWLEISSSGQY